MEQLSNIHIFGCHTCCSVGRVIERLPDWTSVTFEIVWDTMVDQSRPYEPGCHLRSVNGIGSSCLYLQILGRYATLFKWYSIPRSLIYFSANTEDKGC